jgi:phosphate transport system substrate-binding protein
LSAQSDGGISYLALSYFASGTNRKDLNILKINGIEADPQNITKDKYKIWAYEHMYTKGEPTGITKEYLDYMLSNEMTAGIKKLGYIPISEMKVTR